MRRRELMLSAAALPLISGAAAADPFDLRPSAGAPPLKPVTLDFFGIHVHSLALHPGEQRVPTPWPDVPFGWLRLWDSGVVWVGVNPQPGEWEWRRMDAFVDMAERHGTKLLYTFGLTPRWASARPDEPTGFGPGLAAEPTKMSYWTDYVRKVVERYRGRIQAYEVWNEPDLVELRGTTPWRDGFFSGNLKTLMEMTRTASDIVKSVDPSADLLSPAFTNSLPALNAYFAAGGGKLVDAIGYHLYSDSALQFAGVVQGVRAAMARNGAAHLPLWNTESSVQTRPDKISYESGSEDAQRPERTASIMVQMLVLAQSAGLERYFYYAWDDGNSGLVNSKFRAVPAAHAMRRVQDWTIGSRPLGSASLGGKGVHCDYESAAGRSVIAWSETAAYGEVPLPAGWRAVSTQGLFDAVEKTISTTGSLALPLTLAPTRIRLQRIQPA